MEISRREISDMIPLVWRKVTIPTGLGSLMEMITREVIREQPKDLNAFVAQLLEAEAEKEWPAEKEPQSPRDGGRREPVTEATQLLSAETSSNKSQDASVALDMDQSASTTVNLSEGKRDNEGLEPERVVESSPTVESKAVVEIRTDQGVSSLPSDDEVMKKAEASLDTAEIEKIRRVGDFEAISKTITTDESLDIEDEDLENDEDEEEEDEDEEQDAGISEGELEKGNDNYDDGEDEEEEEDSEYGNEDEHVAEILNKHLEDSKSDNELNEAATKIQAGFRGYKARKTLRERKATSSPGSSRTGTDDEHGQPETQMVSPLRTETLDVPRRRVTHNNARQNAKYRSGMVFDGDDDTSDYDNPSSEEILGLGDEYMNKAATRIQANVRGWMTRKHVEKEKYAANNKKQAATKIQATVRGFLTRRRLAKARAGRRRSSHGATLVSSKRRSSLGLKQEAAATKIQAAFRGYNVRKIKPKKKPASSGPVASNESDDEDDSREVSNIQAPLESTTEE